MAIIPEWYIRNIKLRIRVKKGPKLKAIKQKCLCNKTLKRHSNFCSYKNIYSYTIFESGCINITGIKDYNSIHTAIDIVCKFLHLDKCCDLEVTETKTEELYIIDNILYSGSLLTDLPLTLLADYIETNEIRLQGICNLLQFPALFISVVNKPGRMLVFSNGKFVILGVKCLDQFHTILHEMVACIHKFMKMNKKEVLSALAVR